MMLSGFANQIENKDETVAIEHHGWTAPQGPILIFMPDHVPMDPSALSFVHLVTVCFSNTPTKHDNEVKASYLVPMPQSDTPFYVVCSHPSEHEPLTGAFTLNWYKAIILPRKDNSCARALLCPIVHVETTPERGTLAQYVPNGQRRLFEKIVPPIVHSFVLNYAKLPFYPASQSCILVFDHDKFLKEVDLYKRGSPLRAPPLQSGRRTFLSSDRLKLIGYQAVRDSRPGLVYSFDYPRQTSPRNPPGADTVEGKSRICEQSTSAPSKPQSVSTPFSRSLLSQFTTPVPASVSLASTGSTDDIEDSVPKVMPIYQIFTVTISTATWKEHEACAYNSHVQPASSQGQQTWSQGVDTADSSLPSLSYNDFKLMLEESAARSQSFRTDMSTSATMISDLANGWMSDESYFPSINEILGAGQGSGTTRESDSGGERPELPQAVFTYTSDPKVLVGSSRWTAPHSPLYIVILDCLPQCQAASFFTPLTVCYSEDMSIDTNGQTKYLISMPICAGAIYVVCFRKHGYNALNGECKLRWYTMMVSQLSTSEYKPATIVPIDLGVDGCTEYPPHGHLAAYEPNDDSSLLFETCFPPIPHYFVMSSSLALYPEPAACILIIDGALYAEEALNVADFGSVLSWRPAPATRWALSPDRRSVTKHCAKHLRQPEWSSPLELAMSSASEGENENDNAWQQDLSCPQPDALPFAKQAYKSPWNPSSISQHSTITGEGPRFKFPPLHPMTPYAGWDTSCFSEVTQIKLFSDDTPWQKEVVPLPSVCSVWIMEDIPTLEQAVFTTFSALTATPGHTSPTRQIDPLEYDPPHHMRPQRASSESPPRRQASLFSPIRRRASQPAPSPPSSPIDLLTFVPDLSILLPPAPLSVRRGRAPLRRIVLPTDPQADERDSDQLDTRGRAVLQRLELLTDPEAYERDCDQRSRAVLQRPELPAGPEAYERDYDQRSRAPLQRPELPTDPQADERDCDQFDIRRRAPRQRFKLPTDPQAYERDYDQFVEYVSEVEEYDSEPSSGSTPLYSWVPLVQGRTLQLPFTPATGPDTPAEPSTPVQQDQVETRSHAPLQRLELPTDPQAYERDCDQFVEYDSEPSGGSTPLYGWVPLVQGRTLQLPFTPATGPDTPAEPSTPAEQCTPPRNTTPLNSGSTLQQPAPFVCQRGMPDGPRVPVPESSVRKPDRKQRVKLRSSVSPDRKELPAIPKPAPPQVPKERPAGLRANPKKRQLD